MAEQTNGTRRARRSPLDALTLVAGLGVLGVSGYVLSDGAAWFPGFDARWLVAGGAVLIGVLLLIGSLRPKPDR
ncbi:hypothetical protein EV191_109232 [Tamaricihabitans halophyticus]|uniref:Uncharacterized protein n=1 Tax=Tamaricihabitans halophyticus TaxID=1262583 RepID=A0A4R2QJ52_9PSEU|nr:hypothetical protein [Tamaricihabitans halophyticus]TCP49410.1 hypothetical protein EV191_109232 [Tamaricihabitans halophyticus]